MNYLMKINMHNQFKFKTLNQKAPVKKTVYELAK